MAASVPDQTTSSRYGSIDEKEPVTDNKGTSLPFKPSNDPAPLGHVKNAITEKRRIWKNAAVISVAMLLVFTSQHNIMNIESSIDPKMGTRSFALLLVTRCLSSFTISSWLLKKISVNWSIIIGIFGYMCFTSAHLYPRSYTLFPAAAVAGLGSAVLLTAVETYLKKLGYCYAALTLKNNEVVQSQMFGIFSTAFQFTYLLEGVVSIIVFEDNPSNNVISATSTSSDMCGIFYCPVTVQSANETFSLSSNSPSTDVSPSREQVVVVCSVVLSLFLLGGLIIIFFLDPINSFENIEPEEENTEKGWAKMNCNLQRLLPVTPSLVFLAPLPVWAGLVTSYMLTVYSKDFIDCGLGIQMLGPVMVPFGAFATIGALAFGPIVKRFGQTAVITSGGVTCGLFVCLLFVWTTYPHQPLLFVGAGLGGWATAVGQSQVRALFGSEFPAQPIEASSTLVFLESFGLFLNYVLQPDVCNLIKTVLLMTSLALAMMGFGGLHLWKRHYITL